MKFTSLASKFVKPAPKMSNHDWTYLHGTSMAAGPIYPLDVTEVNAGDSYYINPGIEIQTQPLVRPILNDFNFDLYFFYAPQSLYCRSLHSNTGFGSVGANPLSYGLPYFNLQSQAGLKFDVSGSSSTAASVYRALEYIDSATPQFYHPSALLGRLMLPRDYVDNTQVSGTGVIPTITKYNALPLLLYLDVCRSWFANRQYATIPYIGYQDDYDPADNNPLASVNLSTLDKFFANLDDGQNVIQWNPASSDTLTNYWKSLSVHAQSQPTSGLFLASQYPDINNTLLNMSAFSQYGYQSFVSVPSGDEGFAMDTFVQAARFWNFFNIVSLTGTQYDEFSRGVYNVKPDVHLNKPVFLGKRSVPIHFTQIRSTVETQDSPLGSLGGNGFSSFTPSRRDGFRFSFSERGYLLAVAVIRPENMYYQSLPRFATKTTLADAFYPQFNDVGYEDALYSDLRGSVNPLQLNTSGVIPPASSVGQLKTAIAKRPAWTEFRGKLNRLSGLAADPTGIQPWFIAFGYGYSNMPDSTSASLGDNVLWHYVDPLSYSDIFANSNRQAENFIVKIRMNWIARSEVHKRVLPRLTI